MQNRQAKIEVVPSAAALIIRALKEPERDRKKEKNILHNGNISMNDVLAIAKEIRPRSLAKEMVGTVLSVLGTAVSIGCTIDGKTPRELQKAIKAGEITI